MARSGNWLICGDEVVGGVVDLKQGTRDVAEGLTRRPLEGRKARKRAG